MAVLENMLDSRTSPQTALTRSLERILEDAHLSGELKLCGRKLKDFPRTGKYDLTDTVTADLSRNRFTELPVDVTKFWCLEKLNAHHNVIRSIPQSVVFLHSLVYLDLSRNQLTTLPASLCQLPLEILLLSHNKLQNLPGELGQCKALTELDASCNQLTHLPAQLGQLPSLKSLNVRNNLLLELPLELTYLRLVRLDISQNRIATLPVELRNMCTLEILHLSHNPLVAPPAAICLRGRVHIFKWLQLRCVKEDRKKQPKSDVGKFYGGKYSELTLRRYQQLDSGIDWSSSTLSSGTDTMSRIHTSDEGINEVGKCNLHRSNSEREFAFGNQATKSIRASPVFVDKNQNSTTSLTNQELNKNTLHVQTYREYKESLRQQRTMDSIYRPRHISQSSPSSSNTTPSPPEQRRSENKKPVQKVSPSINGNIVITPINAVLVDKQSDEADTNNKSHSDSHAIPCETDTPMLVTASVGFVNSSNSNKETKQVARSMTWNVGHTSPDKLQFTMRREYDKAKEEAQLIGHLRKNIESRLKMVLPNDLSAALSDGVVLCHLANHVQPRAVASIHVPSPTVPKLTMARCRRNVDNFLEACRRIGVDEEYLCIVHRDNIVYGNKEALWSLSLTVQYLLNLSHTSPPHESQPQFQPQLQLQPQTQEQPQSCSHTNREILPSLKSESQHSRLSSFLCLFTFFSVLLLLYLFPAQS